MMLNKLTARAAKIISTGGKKVHKQKKWTDRTRGKKRIPPKIVCYAQIRTYLHLASDANIARSLECEGGWEGIRSRGKTGNIHFSLKIAARFRTVRPSDRAIVTNLAFLLRQKMALMTVSRVFCSPISCQRHKTKPTPFSPLVQDNHGVTKTIRMCSLHGRRIRDR